LVGGPKRDRSKPTEVAVFLAILVGNVFAADFAITNVTAFPITTEPVKKATVLVKDGRIADIGTDLVLDPSIQTIDGTGKYLMPGIIDSHSHMGVYPWPGARAHGDGNEATHPYTPRVLAEDSFKVQDPALERARAGGVTTIMVLPGSANLIGGETAVLKLREARTLEEMRFEDAPRGIKMACGENPKRVYGDDENGPSTRMGNMATMRAVFQSALDYQTARKRREAPPMDHDMETILDVLNGEIRVHVHCYRHDDIEGIYRVMDSFEVQVTSFHHALEAYKVRDMIIEHGTAIATWPDWWGFKMEAFEATPYNAAMVKRDGGVVALHSDSANTVQRMYMEAAKMIRYGATESEALQMITMDPARLIGIDDRVGSIEKGKDADLALFSKHPLDAYTLVEQTWIDGELVFSRSGEEQ
jgi:imidazolonepropionase-like amidohydrolase